MIDTIQNEALTVKISTLGGELQSICTADGKEYLWQGDPTYWADRSPILFPYVGRFTNGCYTLDGETYPMKIHGFFSEQELSVAESSDQSITFLLQSSDKTRAIYPRDFVFLLQYRLEANTVVVSFRVINQDDRELHFGIGGHPGFQVPLDEGLKFDDYQLEFSEPAEPVSIGFSPTCYLEGPDTPFPLEDGIRLPLHHHLFDHDAIVLKGMARSVTLKSPKGSRFVTVTYPNMDYLGLWHCPRTEAPYVCIEPWSSLPSRQDVVEALETHPSILHLGPKGVYTNAWSITLG